MNYNDLINAHGGQTAHHVLEALKDDPESHHGEYLIQSGTTTIHLITHSEENGWKRLLFVKK